MGIKKKRKEEAFKELFEKKHSRLFYASFFIVNDEEDAHDIVEDYMLQLWENFDPDVVYSDFYLFNGIKRRSLDFIKHKKVKAEKGINMHNYTSLSITKILLFIITKKRKTE